LEEAVALAPRNHRITLVAATAHTRRHREAKVWEEKAGAFHKDQVLELLNQPKCVALRIYYGRDEAGRPTLVLTGMDEADNDLTEGIILELNWPCPPFCGGSNSLNT
jgi:hypothetical protein